MCGFRKGWPERARLFRAACQGERLIGGDEFRAEGFQFFFGSLAVFGFQSVDCILYYRDSAATFEQSLGCESDAILCDYAEHYEFSVFGKTVDKFVGVTAFKNIQRLFFEMDLLVGREVGRDCCCWIVRYGDNLFRQRLGNICGTWGAFDT